MLSSNKRPRTLCSPAIFDQIRPLHEEAVDEWLEDVPAEAERFDACPRLNEDGAHLPCVLMCCLCRGHRTTTATGRLSAQPEVQEDDGGEDDNDASARAVGQNQIGIVVRFLSFLSLLVRMSASEDLNTVPQAERGGEGGGVEGLVDSPCSSDGGDIIGRAVHFLLEFRCFERGEVVPGTYHVRPVCVVACQVRDLA